MIRRSYLLKEPTEESPYWDVISPEDPEIFIREKSLQDAMRETQKIAARLDAERFIRAAESNLFGLARIIDFVKHHCAGDTDLLGRLIDCRYDMQAILAEALEMQGKTKSEESA